MERVVRHATGTESFTATRLVYGRNGRTVSYIADESWAAADTNPQTAITNYNITALREYRYDSGRARYMARKYNAALVMANMTSPHQWSSNDGEDPPEWRVVEVFTDYEGDEPYGDFVETDSTSVPPTETASYEPGLWRKDLVSGVAEYLHNDHLGTLRVTSPSGFTGGLGAQRAYTAFGEVVAGPTDRFGYVGAHGYQAHDGVPFLHVGARYYDPGSGRFLQRDPIGIDGDANVYAYAFNSPLKWIDPEGLSGQPGSGSAGLNPKNVKEVVETVRDVEKIIGNHGRVRDYSRHALNQAISREGRGVSPQAILDAVRNASRLRPDGTHEYVGRYARVIINKDGTIVTCHSLNRHGWRIR